MVQIWVGVNVLIFWICILHLNLLIVDGGGSRFRELLDSSFYNLFVLQWKRFNRCHQFAMTFNSHHSTGDWSIITYLWIVIGWPLRYTKYLLTISKLNYICLQCIDDVMIDQCIYRTDYFAGEKVICVKMAYAFWSNGTIKGKFKLVVSESQRSFWS